MNLSINPTYDIDDHPANELIRFRGEVVKDVGIFLSKEGERDRQVMVLQHRSIVVHQRQLQACSSNNNNIIRR